MAGVEKLTAVSVAAALLGSLASTLAVDVKALSSSVPPVSSAVTGLSSFSIVTTVVLSVMVSGVVVLVVVALDSVTVNVSSSSKVSSPLTVILNVPDIWPLGMVRVGPSASS